MKQNFANLSKPAWIFNTVFATEAGLSLRQRKKVIGI